MPVRVCKSFRLRFCFSLAKPFRSDFVRRDGDNFDLEFIDPLKHAVDSICCCCAIKQAGWNWFEVDRRQRQLLPQLPPQAPRIALGRLSAILRDHAEFRVCSMFEFRSNLLAGHLCPSVPTKYVESKKGCATGVARLWAQFWRDLGQECPRYINRSLAPPFPSRN